MCITPTQRCFGFTRMQHARCSAAAAAAQPALNTLVMTAQPHLMRWKNSSLLCVLDSMCCAASRSRQHTLFSTAITRLAASTKLGGSARHDASAGVTPGAAFSSTAVSSDSTPACSRAVTHRTPGLVQLFCRQNQQQHVIHLVYMHTSLQRCATPSKSLASSTVRGPPGSACAGAQADSPWLWPAGP